MTSNKENIKANAKRFFSQFFLDKGVEGRFKIGAFLNNLFLSLNFSKNTQAREKLYKYHLIFFL